MMRLSNGNNTLAEVQKDFDDAAAFLGGNADQWLKKGYSNLITINLVTSKPALLTDFKLYMDKSIPDPSVCATPISTMGSEMGQFP